MQDQREYVYYKENSYFVLALIISILIYIVFAISIIGLIIILALLLVTSFFNAIYNGMIRANGVRLTEEQFPVEYERVVQLSEKMGLAKVPDVFVVQSEGMLNAFATRFFTRNMVVLYSEVFDLARQQGKKELDFIVAHELAHIQRRHLLKHKLIMPAMFIPFLNEAYLRACEHTCDRFAAIYTEDGVAAKNALKILAIGKLVHEELNEEAYLRQIEEESSTFVILAELLSTHPPLPKRIQHIGQFMKLENTPNFTTKYGKSVAGFIGIVFAFILLIVFTVIAFTYIAKNAEDNYYNELLESYDDGGYDETPLMDAAWNNSTEQVDYLISSGVNPNEEDFEGSTPLHYAVYGEAQDTLIQLLEYGANPDHEDENGRTALMIAFDNDYYEIASILLDYGADPDYMNDLGYSFRELVEEDVYSQFDLILQEYDKY